MKTISITKEEFKFILESLHIKKSHLTINDGRLQKYNALINKLNELSPHYEYILEPIQYDEF
jgi:hypothetical protein